jgi:hypothetical protein
MLKRNRKMIEKRERGKYTRKMKDVTQEWRKNEMQGEDNKRGKNKEVGTNKSRKTDKEEL